MGNLQPLQICKVNRFVNNVVRIWTWLLIGLLASVIHLGRFLIHIFFSVFYLGKGKKVPPIKNNLLLKSATRLADDIREGKVKSQDIIQAYIERIREVEPYINAKTYQRFSEAMQEAKEADTLIESGKMTKTQLANEKPLLGIPMSVKLVIQVKNLPFTGASLDAVEEIGAEDADAVKLMKKAGAILLVITNAPEKGLYVETMNKLHGRTKNPYDTSRSTSGSSGGEAALIAAGGSIIGLANDTAGSIRMPSHCCGVYGHTPTPGLVSQHGQFSVLANITTIGPMCRYAEDLVTTMKVLTMDKGIVLKEKMVNFKSMKIYYTMSLCSSFSPTLEKELREVFTKVLNYFEETYGIEALKVEIPLLEESEAIFLHNFLAKCGDVNNIKKLLKIPNDVKPNLELVKYFLGMSKYTFIVPFILKLAKCIPWYKESNVPQYQLLLQQLQEDFDKMLDPDTIFLCPTLPHTALHHTEMQLASTNLSYVGLWNLLRFPATHCPLGLNRNGLPLGIQVIAGKKNDILNLAVACELEKAFGGWVPPQQSS